MTTKNEMPSEQRLLRQLAASESARHALAKHADELADELEAAAVREKNLRRSISSLTKYVAELEASATTDTLTGLKNRRGFVEAAHAAHDQAKRKAFASEHSGVSLLYIDLDDFKPVNDTHGHENGDAMLQRAAKLLVDSCRPGDTVARLGGDEFVILLPDTDRKQAEAFCKRLREKVREELSVAVKKKQVRCSASIGFASATVRATKNALSFDVWLKRLIGRADRSMYKKKNKKIAT